MRITKSQRQQLATFQSVLRAERQAIEAAFADLQEKLADAVAPINSAIKAHNGSLGAARAFAAAVAEELRDEYDGKSERWQESEAGQVAHGMVEEWEDATLEDLEPVRVLAPDAPVWDESLNLPEDDQ